MNFKKTEERILLYKRYESLNIFQELFYIEYNKNYDNKEEVYNSFVELTLDFVNSCKIYSNNNEKSSWIIHIEIYERVIEIIKRNI